MVNCLSSCPGPLRVYCVSSHQLVSATLLPRPEGRGNPLELFDSGHTIRPYERADSGRYDPNTRVTQGFDGFRVEVVKVAIVNDRD